MLAALVVLCTIFALQSEFFLTERNLTTILRNSVDLAVICAAMTIIIIQLPRVVFSLQ